MFNAQIIKAILYTAGTSMVPVLEVKAAIPIGTAMGLTLWQSFFVAVAASSLPAPLIILFVRPILRWLSRLAFLKPAVSWIERHADKKGDQVRKYSLLGLFILVAIPLPGTGVWTGSLVAAVLDLRIKHALPVIFLGNIVASFCILLLTGLFVW